jgi:hypothetical protein
LSRAGDDELALFETHRFSPFPAGFITALPRTTSVIFGKAMRTALAVGLMCSSVILMSCSEKPLPAPDPTGKDLVAGAVIAAEEKNGGYRLYKMQHVDDYPEPIGWEYNMIAYEPKGTSFEDARRLWKDKKVTIALDHIQVRASNFLTRDHRVIVVEPLTPEELAPWKKSQVH